MSRAANASVLAAILLCACKPNDVAPSSADASPATAAASGASTATSHVPSIVSVASIASVASVAPVASVVEGRPPPERDAAALAALVWKTHRGDKFSVLFPGDPKVSILPAEEDRVGYNEAKFDVPGGLVSFAAGFSDHAAADVQSPDKFLDDHVNAPRRGLTDVLHKRSVTLAGHPGRVLILRRNISGSGTPLRIYSRLYLVGPRLYSLIVSTFDIGGVSEDVVKKFMESFKLL